MEILFINNLYISCTKDSFSCIKVNATVFSNKIEIIK